MLKHFERYVAAVTAAVMVTATLSGCGGKKQAASGGEKTFTYFASLTPQHAGATATNLADTPLYQEMEKRTGVKIQFIHPAAGQNKEQLNLLIASNDLPDIVEYTWSDYPGGPQKAIEDKVILRLNDYMASSAPNLTNFLKSDTTYGYDKMVKTDSGDYFVFPFLRGDPSIVVFQGPVVRKDWLDAIGMKEPETVEEWDAMLAAFQKKYPDSIPFSAEWGHIFGCTLLLGAYDVVNGFFQKDGKIVYGPIENGYKQAIAKLSEWYKKGYIDKDFATQTTDNLEAKIMTDKVGSTVIMAGSQIGKVVANATKNNRTDYKIEGIKFPSLVKGEPASFGQTGNLFAGYGAAISANCKDPEGAAKWLDYAYGEEGHMLFNFGIEGLSYNMVDGYPKYTQDITSNPDGLSFAASLARYARSMGSAPIVQDKRYMEQYCALPEQQQAIENWMQPKNEGLLPFLSPSLEDSKTYSTIMSDINTYRDEYALSIVLGQKSIDTFDDYVKRIKEMGIDKAIEIQEKALERYNNR